MKKAKITLRDIAKAAGVSQMTVSRAIRGEPGVSKDIQQKISDLALSMGYVPNRSLHDMAGNRSSMTVGVVLPYLGNTIFAEILENIEAVLSTYGYRILLCCSFNNVIKEFHDISALLERHVDGIIWAPLHVKDSIAAAQVIKKQRCPLVFVDRIIPEWKSDAVLVDDFDGSLALTRHLIDQGFTKIGYIGPGQQSFVEQERRNGFLEAMKERNLPIREEWMLKVKADIPSGKYAVTKLLECPELPEAVFCFNDSLSIGIEMELLNRGIKIPETIALVGFSGTIEMKISRVPITGVFQDAIGLGKISAEFLLKRMINRKIKLAPEIRVLKTFLEPRASSIRST